MKKLQNMIDKRLGENVYSITADSLALYLVIESGLSTYTSHETPYNSMLFLMLVALSSVFFRAVDLLKLKDGHPEQFGKIFNLYTKTSFVIQLVVFMMILGFLLSFVSDYPYPAITWMLTIFFAPFSFLKAAADIDRYFHYFSELFLVKKEREIYAILSIRRNRSFPPKIKI